MCAGCCTPIHPRRWMPTTRSSDERDATRKPRTRACSSARRISGRPSTSPRQASAAASWLGLRSACQRDAISKISAGGFAFCHAATAVIEEAHVAEFVDTTKRAPAGKQIIQMLLDGELDAVLGEKSEHPELRPLFADAPGEENAWFARHGVVPINHMVVVSQELSESHPEAVREVHRLLGEANKASASSPRYSREEMRRSLELIISYTAQQGLIPQPFTFDELFDDVTQALL